MGRPTSIFLYTFTMHNIQKKSLSIGTDQLSFENGRLALQADGSVLIQYGEVAMLCVASISDSVREGMDFFPMVVDFENKYYASGKIKGSRFMKREAKAPDATVIYARMIDRTLRPLLPKNTRNEVQIIAHLMQTDSLHNPGPLGITGASIAMQLAGIPIECAVAGVQVGYDDNKQLILNPTFEQTEKNGLDLIVAGGEDAIFMVEAGANLVSDDDMLAALEFAHNAIKDVCKAQKEFIAMFKDIQMKTLVLKETAEGAEAMVDKVLSANDFASIQGKDKHEVKAKMAPLKEKLVQAYADQIEAGDVNKGDLMYFFDKKFDAAMRARVFEKNERLDYRNPDQVRPIHVEVGVFSRLHGSALFQRGETQALSIVTLAGPSGAQILDDPDRPEYEKHYMHHYNFPPYSVGEIKMLRGPSRRDIGHGTLAERALMPVIPNIKNDGFAYAMRVVSEILTCNGSSSMASVCGSTLSLMDAGVPIKTPISGVAMGLMTHPENPDKYVILSDIQSFEDFGGDMDLKVTGNKDGITALQMDIKIKGLKMELLREAFAKAKIARSFILDEMTKVIAKPRAEMHALAPRIETVTVDPDFIAAIIGKGGENIQRMCKDYAVEINIEDSGIVTISSANAEGLKSAMNEIKDMTRVAQPGEIFEKALVKKIMDFGAFVEYLPKKEALVHVSEMSNARVDHPSDMMSEGDIIKVKYLGKDKQGREKLTMKF